MYALLNSLAGDAVDLIAGRFLVLLKYLEKEFVAHSQPLVSQ